VVSGLQTGKEAFPQSSERTPLGASDDTPWSSHHCDNSLSINLYTAAHETVAATANAGEVRTGRLPLYTPEQRRRRDSTKWTLVQGILAPVQFVVFLVSLALVFRYLMTGEGYALATASVVAKTMTLYAIMITGSIWEREVFGCYLFAPAFYWEDVFSFLVLALHTAYLIAVLTGLGDPRQQMLLALAAYATYVINATQFIMKLRAARLDERSVSPGIAGSRA
jgi:3-vinyl bacteriochlorophyllide hydratase